MSLHIKNNNKKRISEMQINNMKDYLCNCANGHGRVKKKKVVAFARNSRSCHCCYWHIYHWPILFVSLSVCIQAALYLCAAAPSIDSVDRDKEKNDWPPMQHFDIWDTNAEQMPISEAGDVEEENEQPLLMDSFTLNGIELQDNFELLKDSINESRNVQDGVNRQAKVIHLFPVPVDGECLSDDGRRLGNCFNAYECRQKGGTAKGECAMGFGVCCVFIANCNDTITNNITYLVSPNFPSFMPSNFSACNLKVKPMSEDISQLRIDFYHFSLGQPNRRTGVCDGDIFSISGGPSGKFSLCGQNSGQHLYYDVGGRALARQSTLYGSVRPLTYAQLYPNLNVTGNGTTNVVDQLIDINLNFTNRFLPIRLWEIRVAQIPFSQRAPAGCLQYHTGLEGVMQTFNFAENGRHLANQHYRICVRQEREMCSIMYQPCDEQSFRIGSSNGMMNAMRPSDSSVANGNAGMPGGGSESVGPNSTNSASSALNGVTTPMNANSSNSSTTGTTPITTNATTTTTTTMPTTTTATVSTTNATTAQPTSSSTVASTEASTASSPLSDDVEGSGNDYDDFQASTPAAQVGVSRRPRPINIGGGSGGFDLLGFLRSAFDLRLRRSRRRRRSTDASGRQFYSTCTDRITMPCIIEDFIGTGFGPLPGCEPVHCGAQFCSSGAWPCRIESTVTPFYIGVHFGDGAGKGSAEDNIGACLRYTQVQCM